MAAFLFLVTFLAFSAKGKNDFAITASPEGFAMKRGITNCDQGNGVFMCPVGTCYWGDDGFVGCCSVTSCVPRTTCIEYADINDDNVNCDHNTGGCQVCTNSDKPFCFTNTNTVMHQYAWYCDAFRSVATHSFTYSLPDEAKSPVPVKASETTTSEEEEEATTTSRSPRRTTAPTTETDSSKSEGSEGTETSDSGSARIAEVPTTSTKTVNSPTAETSDTTTTTSSSAADSGGKKTAAIAGGVLGGVGIAMIAV
ncbi:Fc.00g096230.m01.CDS01, partial [Cosmosporella sp. VM-42]